MKVAAVIPAKDEAETVQHVAKTARNADLVDEVVVVSADEDTARAAEGAGARVLRFSGSGKGAAMVAGVEATDAPVILFLDADLLGLREEHVEDLVRPVVEGRAGMACGLFDRGGLLNPVFLRLLPILTGERALRRELFEALDPEDVRGYKVEAALNSAAREHGVPVVAFVCDGMWHRTKEEKASSWVVGFLRKQGMLLTAMWGYLSYWLRSRLRRRGRSSSR